MKQVLIILTIVFLLVDFAVASEEVSNECTDQGVLAEFTFTKGDYGIFLPVQFKGKEHLFVFDTGATLTVFDTSLKHNLGRGKKTVFARTSGKPIPVEIFDAPKAFLGPLSMQGCGEVVCMDLKIMGNVAGRKIDGIIGMNFLKNHIVQIDFDRGKLLFLKTMAKNNSYWGTPLPITYNLMGMPQIKGSVLDSIMVEFSEDFVIDTGADFAGDLNRKILDEILARGKTKVSEEQFGTGSGIMKSRIIRISDIQIGPSYCKNLIFREGNWSSLGLEFLSRHLVTFDFPSNRLYLKKGKDFDKIDEINMSGLHLVCVSNEVVVHSVDEGSPAHEAGIHTDDVIAQINNKDSNAYEMWEVRDILKSKDGQEITMTIKRGDEIKEVSLTLRRKI